MSWDDICGEPVGLDFLDEMDPEKVETRQDLVAYLTEMWQQVQRSPEAVLNSTLAMFLSGAAGWVEDFDAYFTHRGEPIPEEPSWRLIAEIFAAGTEYE